MKTIEKEFNIYKNMRPRVLLLGNGLCRSFGGMSWNKLLDEIKDPKFALEANRYVLPMPLKAAMLAGKDLASKMRKLVTKMSSEGEEGVDWTSFVKTTMEMRQRISNLIIDNFDYVLTTNYSYEIEASILGLQTLTPEKIRLLMNYHEVKNAQNKFLINTYNKANGVPVWHIHGEARKPDSMIIGSYYYGKLLRRCIERLDGNGDDSSLAKEKEAQNYGGKTVEFKRNLQKNKAQKIGSWVDAFVLGDVYILGLGMDFSEADLWWLIEYKRNNSKICGRTVFLEPQVNPYGKCLIDEEIDCKHATEYINGRLCKSLLLKSYGVEIDDLGFTINEPEDYKLFYDKAINRLKNRNT